MKGTEEIQQPQISEETMKQMASFFMKTSIPRILAEKKKEIEQSNNQTNKRLSIRG